MEQTIVMKLQILVSSDNKENIHNTMKVYSEACNFVSDYIFKTHNLKQFSLNNKLYSTLRDKFGLRSQMAQSVL